MRVKQITLETLDEVRRDVQQLRTEGLGGIGYTVIDVEPLSYMQLLDRLLALGELPRPAAVVVLFNSTDDTRRQLRRIRRNQGKSLGNLTVFTVAALSEFSEVLP